MQSDPSAMRPIDAKRQRKEATRDAMIVSAAGLFATAGYAGTTMEAVASGAGMSVQSVYFAFGTKAALLRAAFERGTPGPTDRLRMDDADDALAWLVGEAVRSMAALGPLALAAAAAAPADPAVAEVRDWYEHQRSRSCTDLVHQLRSLRPLAQGVTVRRASDVVYGLLSPQLHALLVDARGWSSKRYARWAVDAIGRALWG